MFVIASSSSSPKLFNRNKGRALEKVRIQKLKNWHEGVKKIARSEIDFITSIFKDDDDKNFEDRDWIRDDEENKDEERDGALVKKDS